MYVQTLVLYTNLHSHSVQINHSPNMLLNFICGYSLVQAVYKIMQFPVAFSHHPNCVAFLQNKIIKVMKQKKILWVTLINLINELNIII